MKEAHPRLSPGHLVRGLALVPGIAVTVAHMVGTGVFLKARVMTCNVGTSGMVILVWIVAGLLSLAGALTYAELGTMMPYSGGEYAFLRTAYGRLWAFLNGWMRTVIDRTGGAAALAVAFVIFLNDLSSSELDPIVRRLLPIAVIALATLINLASVRAGGLVATVLTAVKTALVLGVGVGAFLLVDGSREHFAMSSAAGSCDGVPDSARLGVAGFGAAMLGALWAYDGWNTLTHLGEEVRDPHRNIPRALVGGILIVIALYVFINAAYFWVLTPEVVASVSTTSSVAVETARRFIGPGAVGLMAAGLMASSFGSLHATLLTGSRITFAMARDGQFPPVLAAVYPCTRVPSASVLFHGAWASILSLTGSFDALTNFAVFGSWIFYGMTGAAVFVLRRKQPDAERPFRTWGYPVVPGLFLLVTVFLFVSTLVATPVEALAGIGLILLGLPVYAYYSRRGREGDG